MIHTVIFALFFLITLILSVLIHIPYYIFHFIGRRELCERWVHFCLRNWSRALLFVAGARVEVNGIENVPDGNLLIVSNHQSYFDILIVVGYVPKLTGFIAKRSLKYIPLFSDWMRKIHCVFINRKNLKESYGSIMEGVKSIKSGNSLLVFPEGTRSKGNKMNRFKPGSFKLAELTGVPILPITIDGAYHLFEEKGKIQSARVYLTIHKPIITRDLAEEEKKELPGKVFSIVQTGMKRNL